MNSKDAERRHKITFIDHPQVPEKTPENRYASASVLAEDWVDTGGEPVTARPTGTMRRLWSWSSQTGIAGLVCCARSGCTRGHGRSCVPMASGGANLQEARTQEQCAVGNFRLARSAVDETLTRVSENRRRAGYDMQQSLPCVLLFSGVGRFQCTHLVAQCDLMTAYKRLGDITREIGSIEDAKSYYQHTEHRAVDQCRPADTELTSGERNPAGAEHCPVRQSSSRSRHA